MGELKKSVSEASREVVRRGERISSALRILRRYRSARLARRYFSYLTPFFAFFPYYGAWSQASWRADSLLSNITFLRPVNFVIILDLVVS